MPQRLTSFASTFALASLFSLAGCSQGDHATGGSGTTTGTVTGPDCSTIAPQCAASQQGCVEGASGASCQPCPAGHYATSTGSCEAVTGTPLSHTFPDQTTTPGQEVLGLCRAWTIDNDTDLWVSAVELTQSELSHHSNWVFVPDTVYDGPDGIFDCGDRSYDFYKGVGYGGLLYAQSTQASHEVQHFAGGAAIHVPAHARIVSDIHLLNTGSTSNTGHAELTLYTVPASEAKVKLVAFHVEYDALTIPPQATSRFTAHCAVSSTVSQDQGAPFAPKVYYLLPHTHTLASGFFAQVLGGPLDGQSLLDLPGYNGEARGRTFDTPVDMTGADGFTFACQYTNPRTTSVGWGFGTQEMCELFGFADTPEFFQSRVGTGSADGTDPSGVQLFGGDCETEVISAPQ